jgi:photosystem II stability/assembly factor-like uncharacterized protein
MTNATHDRISCLLPLVLAGLASSAFPISAGVNVWTSSGPEGAYIEALAANPSNPSTVYAATVRRIYKSVDAGAHWTSTGLAGRFNLLLATSAPSTAYATWTDEFDVAIFRTRDGGESWVDIRGPRGRLVSLSGDPDDPMALYAVTVSGFFRSENGGESWQELTNPAPGRSPRTIAVDPADSRMLYAAIVAASETTVFRSADRGATWSRTSLRDPVRELLFDPRNASRLFALTTAGLQVTTNRGESWRRLAADTENAVLIAIDPIDSNRLYLLTGTDVLRSTDGGETVTRVSSGDFGEGPRAVASAGSGLVLVGTDRGLSRSEDAGGLWSFANHGIQEVFVRSVAVDPTDSAVILAAGDQGIYESRDRGETWNGPAHRSPDADLVVIDPVDPSTVYAAGRAGVDKSTDGGRTWQRKLADQIADLVIDPNNSRRVLAAYRSVYRSIDGTESWDTLITPEDDYVSYYYPPRLNAISIAPSDSATVYAAGSGDTSFFYRSDDGGNSWSDPMELGSFWIGALEVDSCDPRILHAGGYGVRRSVDGGNTWSEGQLSVYVFDFERDPRHSSSIFAGTSNGVFWSNDRGVTWTRFEPALGEPVFSLALDSSGRFLYAGTEHGVYQLERSFEACLAGPDQLCLIGAKFQVTVTARHPQSGDLIKGRAIAEGDEFGYFSLPDVTGDPEFPEVFVKMADARGAPPPYGGHAWVFHSSLTDLDYTVTVRETDTGRVRTYTAADSAPLTCGLADTSAFARGCEADPSSISVAGSRLAASGAELSLLGGRFRATIRATDPRTGRIAEGAAIARQDGFGYFSLPDFTGDPRFPEVFVKMVDGRAQPGRSFWVFHTGLTDLAYTLTVTDTVTGAVRTYTGGATAGTFLCGSADTTAFRD